MFYFSSVQKYLVLLLSVVLGVVFFFGFTVSTSAQSTLSYQSRVAINDMIASDLQVAGSIVTIDNSGTLTYDDPSGFDGLSANSTYGDMADEVKLLLGASDIVEITATGAFLVQGGNTPIALDISLNNPPPSNSNSINADGTVNLVGTIDFPNIQYDTFLPNLPGSQPPVSLYVVFGPTLNLRTNTESFNRASCGTPDVFDFCFSFSDAHRDDYFAIYQDLPNTLRDVRLIGPHQFSMIADGQDRIATFEERWYYILFDWRYERPDGSYSQNFSTQQQCQAEASLVNSSLQCEEILGDYIRHSHYFDTSTECYDELTNIIGDTTALCYSTQVRNIEVLFDIPFGVNDDQLTTISTAPTTTYVGQTTAFLKGTIDTKGTPATVLAEVFGVPRYVLDANGVTVVENGFKQESRVYSDLFTESYGNTYQKINLALLEDDNVHILAPQGLSTQGSSIESAPGQPKEFNATFNLPSIASELSFPEPLKKDYIYYYRVYNPLYVAADQTVDIFEFANPVGLAAYNERINDPRTGYTYAEGWFTTGDVVLIEGGEVGTLGETDISLDGEGFGPLENDVEGDPNVLFNPLDIVEVDSIPKLVERVFEGFRLIVGPLAALLIVWVAFLFITSAGKPEKQAQAQETLKYVVIGLGVLVGAYVLGLGVQSVVTCLSGGVCL